MVSGAEAKIALYNAADCLVLASAREGFPAVVGEAMACGTPVFAPRGGIPELVVDGVTGDSVNPETMPDCAISWRTPLPIARRWPRCASARARRLKRECRIQLLRPHCGTVLRRPGQRNEADLKVGLYNGTSRPQRRQSNEAT